MTQYTHPRHHAKALASFDLPCTPWMASSHSLKLPEQIFSAISSTLWAAPTRLFFLDGFYDATNNQPSSSSGSVAQRLFHQYRALTFHVNDDCVPGVASGNHVPYVELQQLDLLRLTSTQIQTQFYQEARIEVAVFMGCKKGEIELGFSKMFQGDIQTALKNLFGEDLYIHYSKSTSDEIPPSSLSTGRSDQSSSLLLTIPGTSQSQTSLQAFAQVIPSYFPTPEGEHEAIVKAFLQVISSPSQQHQPHHVLPTYTSPIHPREGDTALERNRPDIISTPNIASNFVSQSLRNIAQPAPPINTQQHHMISERRRRQKLNENFEALRTLLPPGTKKNKGSILITAKERVRSLMDEIERLNTRNQQLVTVLPGKEATATASTEEKSASSSNARLNVRVLHVLESTSSVDLQVSVRGENSRVDVLIRLLEFLERVQNINLISMAANNHITGGIHINQLTFRLRIIEVCTQNNSSSST
ncbi:putative transcription factor bHLH041, partial [Mucuna pruriens]